MLYKLLFPNLKDKYWSEVSVSKIIMPINEYKKLHGIDFAYGGYFENFNQYRHIGIDYYIPKNMNIVLPKPGKVVLIEEDQINFEVRVIFRMSTFYVTFAHLSMCSVQVGQKYFEGVSIGRTSEKIHIHCMREYEPFISTHLPYKQVSKERFPNPEEVLV